MFFFEFRRRLKKLNPSLYVADDRAAQLQDPEWKVLGLYIKRTAQAAHFTDGQKVLLDGDARRYIDAQETGHMDEHVCSVPANWVPERDIFGANGRLLARGWRSIVQTLISRRLTTVDRARAAFSSSLGETVYDRMSFEQRRDEATAAHKKAGFEKILADHRIKSIGSF